MWQLNSENPFSRTQNQELIISAAHTLCSTIIAHCVTRAGRRRWQSLSHKMGSFIHQHPLTATLSLCLLLCLCLCICVPYSFLNSYYPAHIIIITFCQGASRATKMEPRKNDFGWRTPANPRLKHILSNIANSKPHPGRASGTIFNACLDFEGAVLKVAGGPFKCEHCHC